MGLFGGGSLAFGSRILARNEGVRALAQRLAQRINPRNYRLNRALIGGATPFSAIDPFQALEFRPRTSFILGSDSIRERVLANIAASRAARQASNFPARRQFIELAQFRQELGLPPIRGLDMEATVALLEIDGRRFWGSSSANAPSTSQQFMAELARAQGHRKRRGNHFDTRRQTV
ncbi:MAG: hypothetical protein KatS3mg105_2141 [Gemmatales bacterium]|nr:MAG: hypothetical protein KatS3mg105_2141 [Gemmatales bacterium]